jgi:hypothetical protein
MQRPLICMTRLTRSMLCLGLCGLLMAAPLQAQQPFAPSAPAPAGPPTLNPVALEAGVAIKLVLLDTVSSATAVKGQPVRFAVVKDVLSGGVVAIARGTLATGIVKKVTRGVPGKHNGYVLLEPRSIALGNGVTLKLSDNAPGEDPCGEMGPCWIFATILVILSPLIAVGVAIYEIHHLIAPHQPNAAPATTYVISGEDTSWSPCWAESAYTRSRLTVSAPQPPAALAELISLGGCPPRRGASPKSHPAPQPEPASMP